MLFYVRLRLMWTQTADPNPTMRCPRRQNSFKVGLSSSRLPARAAASHLLLKVDEDQPHENRRNSHQFGEKSHSVHLQCAVKLLAAIAS